MTVSVLFKIIRENDRVVVVNARTSSVIRSSGFSTRLVTFKV
jgi:hypothetical protein